jgi:polysaccharide biosynthesis protein PslF
MRIGLIAGEYPPMEGGVGAYTHVLAHHFADLGHDVMIYADQRAQEPDDRIHLDATIDQWTWGKTRRVYRWAQDHKLDILNLQFETAAFGMSPWVHFLPGYTRDFPLVTTFHDMLVPYLFPKAGPLRGWIVNRLARKSDGVIVTNHEDWSKISDLNPLKLIPIGSNIPDACPEDYERDAWRSQAGAGPDDFLIAHFGFINHSKGIEILLEDVAYLVKSGYPVRVIMIGGKTGTSDPTNVKYAQSIDTLIDALGLNDVITWTGFLDQPAVSAYLHASDAVVLPFRDGASFRRGSLMAAIQHACPIITTRPRVNIPAFMDGKNMLLTNRHILDENCPPFLHISPAVLKLYRSPALRDQLRRGARKLARQFDWTAIASEYITFFQSVIKARQAR